MLYVSLAALPYGANILYKWDLGMMRLKASNRFGFYLRMLFKVLKPLVIPNMIIHNNNKLLLSDLSKPIQTPLETVTGKNSTLFYFHVFH